MSQPDRSPAAIAEAIRLRLASGPQPDSIAIPGADWAALAALRTSDGRPIFAGPPRIWGTPVHITPGGDAPR